VADAQITLTVLRGSIPSACYVVGGEVSAAIVLVDGLPALVLDIAGIEVGTGDTDEVTFAYDDVTVPAGVTLSECHFSSFQCICDCCAEKRCFEVVGPNVAVAEGSFHVGFLPGKMLVDQIRIYSPHPSGFNFEFVVLANGQPVTVEQSTTNSPTVIERADFTEAFESGVLLEDTELYIVFNAVPTGGGEWNGLTLCLLGRWLA
jgi:hypothetical protein